MGAFFVVETIIFDKPFLSAPLSLAFIPTGVLVGMFYNSAKKKQDSSGK